MKKKQIFLAGLILIFVLVGSLNLLATDEADEVVLACNNCNTVMDDFLNHLRWGGTAEGAKEYCHLPLNDYRGTLIPYDEFIAAVKERLELGWKPLSVQYGFVGNVIIIVGRPGHIDTSLSSESRPLTIYFRQFDDQWKIKGLIFYDPNDPGFSYGHIDD